MTNLEDIVIKTRFNGKEINNSVNIWNPAGEIHVLAKHGFGSNSKESFGKFVEFLPEEICLVAWDWIGYGGTDKPLGERDTYFGPTYCTSWDFGLTKKLIDERILNDKYYIIAKSQSSISTAKNYPFFKGNILGIVFESPAGLDKRISKIFATLSTEVIRSKFLSNLVPYLISEKSKREELKENLKREKWREVTNRYARNGFGWNGKMRSTHYFPELFKEIDCPTMLISGERDSIFYERGYLNYAEEYSWQIEIINGTGHSPGKEKPKESAEAIVKFINRVECNQQQT